MNKKKILSVLFMTILSCTGLFSENFWFSPVGKTDNQGGIFLDCSIEYCESVLGEPVSRQIFSYEYHQIIVLSYQDIDLFFLSAGEKSSLARMMIIPNSAIVLHPIGLTTEIGKIDILNAFGEPKKTLDNTVIYTISDTRADLSELKFSLDGLGKCILVEYTSEWFYL